MPYILPPQSAHVIGRFVQGARRRKRDCVKEQRASTESLILIIDNKIEVVNH
jgi:hypothetical protein